MDFIKGMDISMLKELEDLGVAYYTAQRVKKDCLDILKEYDVNAIRLRIWNHPYDVEMNPYGGGTNDYNTTRDLAKRVVEKGMDFFLDFHYSDFWADPGKQIPPKSWVNMGWEELGEAVYQYTYETINNLKKENLMPNMVQIGNEITNGLLWPIGKLSNVENMAHLLNAGIQATKDVSKEIKIMLHLDDGGNNALYRRWFDSILPYELDFDVIGLSYYPFWHGTLEDLSYNLNDISKTYNKDVIVAETAYGFTTKEYGSEAAIFSDELAEKVPYEVSPEGQAHFMNDLMKVIKEVGGERGLGFFYWEPGWVPTPKSFWASEIGKEYIKDDCSGENAWANLALFDFEGVALPALEAIRKFNG
ncbi:MAG: glycosyl hydrolase [Clostridiales bacterium]|nr:glycosyl hydrolase [Clostridiales bacterium]